MFLIKNIHPTRYLSPLNWPFMIIFIGIACRMLLKNHTIAQEESCNISFKFYIQFSRKTKWKGFQTIHFMIKGERASINLVLLLIFKKVFSNVNVWNKYPNLTIEFLYDDYTVNQSISSNSNLNFIFIQNVFALEKHESLTISAWKIIQLSLFFSNSSLATGSAIFWCDVWSSTFEFFRFAKKSFLMKRYWKGLLHWIEEEEG